jgi:hypothetical protein
MSSVEQEVRKLVRAWPIPDRVERGEEIVATTLDLVPDGKNHLTFAMALNLVVGGLGARWRMRPPPWRWFYYRMGGRLNQRWHRWLLNDLSRSGWRRRMVVFRLSMLLPIMVLAWLTVSASVRQFVPFWSWTFLSVVVGGSMGILTHRSRDRRDRDKQLARHGYLHSAQSFPSEPPSVSAER